MTPTFRGPRRFKQQLPDAEVEAILESATSGVLALLGPDGYPYAVPLSFVYRDGKIYFHGALKGHKIDAVRHHDRASFCVIDRDRVVAEEFTTDYRSVIAFGRVRLVEDVEERRHIAQILADKYAPGDIAGAEREIAKGLARMAIIELDIEHLTGKVGSYGLS